jgi:hypothetical protein
MKVVAANRRELWVSIAIVLAAVVIQRVPLGFTCALVLGGSMAIGLVCAVNAALGLDEMGVVETYIAVLWLIALLILTPLTFYCLLGIQEFANR